MPASMTRRAVLRGVVASAPALISLPRWKTQAAAASATALAELESRHGGRLGVAVLNTHTGARTQRRGDQRFAMCSTFKILISALVLTRVDRGEEALDRRMIFEEDRLVTYSPITEKRVGAPGMTVAELCEAALTMSDNTAANVILSSVGGPSAVTAYARSIRDTVTRLDRIEPRLNEATPGDPRDTTTPSAMLEDLRQLILGNALSSASRSQLTLWLVANKTGDARLRAGFPKDWRVGDKTGSGNYAATNDVAVAWPPGRGPVLLSVYYAESSASVDQRNAILADVARIIAASI
jgi:beta-lactamase class A